MHLTAFKERFRVLRGEKALSMEALGKELGVTKGTISRYENGGREPDFDMLCRIADFFGVSIDYLLGRTNNR
jgi:transcriptional regulator with XRE-family HTH domain